MAITIDRHDDLRASVFHVEGDIDIALVPELRESLQALLDTGVNNIVLDMTDVVYADSSALGLLVWLDQRLEESDGKVVLAGANRDVRRILEVSGLVTVAPNLSESVSVHEALDGLQMIAEAPAQELWCEEIEMVADVEHLGSVREQVCSLMSPLDFDESAVFDIKVALGEALANAVRHGSPGGDGHVNVKVTAYDDRVALEVRDSGTGFDGQHAGSDDLYASGGRGIMFMRALMDRVEFQPEESGGTTVRLVKHRAVHQD